TQEEEWSDQFYRNLGLEPGSCPPSVEKFYEHVHPDDRQTVFETERRSVEEKQPHSIDFRVIWPDGSVHAVHEKNDIVLGEDGEVVALVGTTQDVTENREIADKLSSTADRLARAQQTAKIGNWEWTIATGQEYWSDQMYRNFGLDPGSIEATDDNFYEHVHPDDREGVRRTLQATIETGKPYSFGFRVVWPDGTERLVHEEGEALLGDNGETVGLAGTMQDVTELRASENRLRRLAQSFANAQRIAHTGNWDWDAVTKVEWWSDEIYRIMGLEPASATASYDAFMERTHPDDRKKVGEAIAAAQNSLGSYNVDFRIVRPDGGVRIVRETGECVLDAEGRFTGLTGAVQDITEQHEAERQLSETARRLGAATRLAHLGDWAWDPDSDRLGMSEETLRICGLGPEHAEVDNDFLMAMIPAEEHSRIRRMMNRAVSKGEAYTNEYHIVRPDGDRRAVIEHGEAFRDETTGKIRLIGTIQDITERQRAAEELARTLKRLADAQTAARIGNWEWDAATNQDWWSEQQFRNYGIEAPAGFVPSENYLQFAHPADREAAQQAVDRSVETGTPLDIEFRAIGADGVERMLWVHGITEAGADGRVIRTVGTTQDVTVRKHAEQELARTTERLKEAQRIANIGNWEWRSGSTDSVWSDEMYRIFGVEPGAIHPTHDRFFGMVHEDDRKSIATMMAHTVETGQPYETEFRINRADGAMRHVFERGERFIDERTGEWRVRGTMQDITERKAAEEKLRETAENLEKSERIAKLGSWVWDIEEDKEWWSDEIYRFLGMETGSAAVSGYDYLKYVHPDDRERVGAALDKSLKENAPYVVEYRFQHADGHEIIVLEQAETEFDRAGKPIRMRGIAQDITDRKQAELVLQQTMERLEEAQRIGQMGSWTWDPGEDLEWWSDEQYRIFGFEPGSIDIDGFGFLKYVHPDDRDRVEKNQRQAVANLTPFSDEYRVIWPDGTERIVSEYGELIDGDPSGKPQWRGVLQDITERKRIEQELARLNTELEQRVEERTAALRNAQAELVRSERLATLGQLTGTVAHELRNPLGAIMNSLGVIRLKCQKAGVSLDMDKSLDRADRGIKRCDGIITELLDFARSRGLQPEPTALDAWLGELLDEQQLPEGITVVRDCGLDDTVVSIDRDEVRRAVINVIDNACQAITNADGNNGIAGCGVLTVATRGNGERIEIEIADTGPGIPEDVLPNIFEPLFSTKSFGVGLGLSIVRQVMEHHGGGLEIASKQGQGTQAVLWLPISRVQQSG
ncbi:MAG: PAS domain-containing protein, partial [Alphaproteobacteria bacterium]|nr:PAS domain-containing protein [Alphaproteobacteria bacterium]